MCYTKKIKSRKIYLFSGYFFISERFVLIVCNNYIIIMCYRIRHRIRNAQAFFHKYIIQVCHPLKKKKKKIKKRKNLFLSAEKKQF